jgi:uncharacterized protein (TIGR02246 family)
MRVLLLTLLFVPSFVLAQTVSPDETAIREAVLVMEKGWNAGDAKMFGSYFTEDADYVVVNGMHLKGRKAIDEGHERIFATVYKGSVNKATIKSVRFLCPDVAIAHVAWHLKFGENRATEARAMNTMVWQKKDGKWQAVAFHNTPVVAPPAAN